LNLEIIKNRLKVVQTHYNFLKQLQNHIQTNYANQDFHLSDLEIQDKAIFDATLYRFSQLQDYLGDKIFPLIPEFVGKSTISFVDTLNFLEKEGIIDANEWKNLRIIRNFLSHNYSEDKEELEDNLKIALQKIDTLLLFTDNLLNYINKNILG